MGEGGVRMNTRITKSGENLKYSYFSKSYTIKDKTIKVCYKRNILSIYNECSHQINVTSHDNTTHWYGVIKFLVKIPTKV